MSLTRRSLLALVPVVASAKAALSGKPEGNTVDYISLTHRCPKCHNIEQHTMSAATYWNTRQRGEAYIATLQPESRKAFDHIKYWTKCFRCHWKLAQKDIVVRFYEF